MHYNAYIHEQPFLCHSSEQCSSRRPPQPTHLAIWNSYSTRKYFTFALSTQFRCDFLHRHNLNGVPVCINHIFWYIKMCDIYKALITQNRIMSKFFNSLLRFYIFCHYFYIHNFIWLLISMYRLTYELSMSHYLVHTTHVSSRPST